MSDTLSTDTYEGPNPLSPPFYYVYVPTAYYGVFHFTGMAVQAAAAAAAEAAAAEPEAATAAIEANDAAAKQGATIGGRESVRPRLRQSARSPNFTYCTRPYTVGMTS